MTKLVAASTAETRAMRDLLLKVDGNGGRLSRRFEKAACGPDDQIPIIRRDGGVVAREGDAFLVYWRDIKGVCQRERRHQAFNFMKAIRALSQN